MNEEAFRILLVEDDPADADLLRQMMLRGCGAPFTLSHASGLGEAMKQLRNGRIHAVLLDLSLPDSKGIETVQHVRSAVTDVPIVALTSNAELSGLETIRAGAEDYLSKAHLTSELLWHALRNAIERHRMQRSLYQMAVMDDLTGLYNRRGFLSLAKHQMRLANRSWKAFWLLSADLDNLKTINDTFGHEEGNAALVVAATALKETFRDSDVIGRIGGDEFAVLALESSAEGFETFRARLRDRLAVLNSHNAAPYRVSLSVGQARYDPSLPCSIEELSARADERLYEDKGAHGKRAVQVASAGNNRKTGG